MTNKRRPLAGTRRPLKLVLLLLLLSTAIILTSESQSCPGRCSLEGDLNGNGIREEYVLDGQRLTVTENSRTLWVSPYEYDIDTFALGDIKNDGGINLVISLWKKGSFGEARPFWHTGRDDDYKNHLFIYGVEDGAFTQVWCSSNLDRPILSFAISDTDRDGLNELVVEEGQYKKILAAVYTTDRKAASKTTVWQWDEWGFRLQD